MCVFVKLSSAIVSEAATGTQNGKNSNRLSAEKRRKERSVSVASQWFLLKIYSVQLHEKYHLVSLVSQCFVSHLGGCLWTLYFLSFFLSILSHVPTFHSPRTLSFPLLYLLFLAFMRPYVPCLAQRARTPYSFFSITMPSGAWRAEQFRVRDYASRAILQLIGSAGMCAEAYLIVCFILNYAS